MLKGYDASTPVYPTGFDAAMFYIGGDTPHVWSDMEVMALQTRYKVPIYTRAPVAGHSGVNDAEEALSWMMRHQQPYGTVVVLDFETTVDPLYAMDFDAAVTRAGYRSSIYGSESSLFQNHLPSAGYFLARPGATELDPRTMATQYAMDVNNGAWDESFINPVWPMWDTMPYLTGEDGDMILIAVKQDGDINPGIFVLSGGLYAHVDSTDDLNAFRSLKVPEISVSVQQHENLLAGRG